jgi:Ca-activated chloride channel family protein
MKTILRTCICVSFISAMISLAYADGFIVTPEPHPVLRTPYPLEVKSHHVETTIDGLSAVTKIDQEFFNPTVYRLEGYYIFPVPKGALIRTFSMEIDGKNVEAELLDAAKARTIYEDIVRKQLDPALLEFSDRSMFKVRIFPIEPKSVKRVKIQYEETLSRESGTVEYVYPLGTEKFSSKNVDDVSVHVTIKSEGTISAVTCPTHEASVAQENNSRATVKYHVKDSRPDSDFKVYFTTTESRMGLIFRGYRDDNDEGFFFINASPAFAEKPATIEKDIVFVLDTSGSMAGEKLESAKRALMYCVKNLNEGDRFQIVRFSTEADSLFEKVTVGDKQALGRAGKFIDAFKPVGGTNIEDALKSALDSFTKESRPKMIVFITDGKPTLGETDEEKLLAAIKKQNGSTVRIFTFGVGYDINTHLLDRLTDMTRAYRSYITPKEEIEKAVSSFYAKIQSPVLTDITVKINGVKESKVYPKDIPDLYSGSSITLFGRYADGGAGDVVIEGKLRGKSVKYEYKVKFPDKDISADYIPPLWASRRVGHLLDQMRLYGESKEVIDEIVLLARTYGILTPYTSYLILEDEARKVERNEIAAEKQSLGNAIPEPQTVQEYKKDLYAMKSKSGEGSVRASRSVQDLSDASNAGLANRQKFETTYQSKGQQKRLVEKTKVANGITFYQAGEFWNDSRIVTRQKSRVVKIKFASSEYFELLKKDTAAKHFMSVGQNVRFVSGDLIYEIAK